MGSASTLGVSGAAAGSGPGAGPGDWLPPLSGMGPASPAPLAAGVTTKRWDMVARAPAPAARFPAPAGLHGSSWAGRGGAGAGAGPAAGTSLPLGPGGVKHGGAKARGRRGPGGTTRRAVGGQSLGNGAHSLREAGSLPLQARVSLQNSRVLGASL